MRIGSRLGQSSGGPAWTDGAVAASQQEVRDFREGSCFEEVPLPRRHIDVKKHLDNKHLGCGFAVFRQRQEQNFGMPLRGPLMRRDEQTLPLKAAARPYAFIRKP